MSKQINPKENQKTPVNYVNNKVLFEEIRDKYYPLVKEWREGGREGPPPPVTDIMARDIFLISTNFCSYRKFKHLKHLHDDLAAYAALTVMKYIHNFNPEKYDKPFAYITRIVNNAFLQYLKRETRNNKAKSVAAQRYIFDQMMSGDPESAYMDLLTDKIERDQMEDDLFEKNNEDFKTRGHEE